MSTWFCIALASLRQNCRRTKSWGMFALPLLVALALLPPGRAEADGIEVVVLELRVDLDTVYNSRDYKTWVLPVNLSSSSIAHTPASLEAWADSAKTHFLQVGVSADTTGVFWFAYSDNLPNATCLRGNIGWNGKGCFGNYGDLSVGLNRWTQVELVTYGQGYWIARVRDDQTGAVADVARLNSSSTRIYRAAQVGESAYSGGSPPQTNMRLLHWHPLYMLSGRLD